MWLALNNFLIGIVYFFGYVVAIFLGNYVVCKVLSRIEVGNESCSSTGLEGAGKIIGVFERILVVTFMYLNVPTAIAIVFAAKSIVRFESTKDRKFAEYFLVGTLGSITIAVVVGTVFAYVAGTFTSGLKSTYLW